jgi:hypothetical protein
VRCACILRIVVSCSSVRAVAVPPIPRFTVPYQLPLGQERLLGRAQTVFSRVWLNHVCRMSHVVAAPKAAVAATNPITMATMKSYLSQPCPPRCANGIGRYLVSASGNAIGSPEVIG